MYVEIRYLKLFILYRPKNPAGKIGKRENRDGIFELLSSPGIDSKESIPPAYVPGGKHYSYLVPSPHRLF
jgi:hypothetical protein